MRTIDAPEPPPLLTPTMPSIKTGEFDASGGIGSMRALQDKRDEYQRSCQLFLDRLHQFLTNKFGSETIEQLKRSKSQLEKVTQSSAHGARPQIPPHDDLYISFWRFVGLLSFARDINEAEYAELQKLYEKPTKQLFMEEIRDHVLAWKKITKTPSPDEIEDWIFTTPEREPEHSAVTAARKLTVKKSIARIRGDSMSYKERPSSISSYVHGHHHSLSGSGGSISVLNPNGVVQPHVAFEAAFSEITMASLKEQNFLTEYFMISSRSSMDFLELVSTTTPDTRRLGDLGGIRASEPDKERQKEIRMVMEQVFSFLPTELGGLVDWVVGLDPTQAVGVLCVVEQKVRRLEETDQEWIRGVLEEIMKAVEQKWQGWVEEQTRAIEETKVKVKKRKGVVGFIRVFPVRPPPPPPYSFSSSFTYSTRPLRNMWNRNFPPQLPPQPQLPAQQSTPPTQPSIPPYFRLSIQSHSSPLPLSLQQPPPLQHPPPQSPQPP